MNINRLTGNKKEEIKKKQQQARNKQKPGDQGSKSLAVHEIFDVLDDLGQKALEDEWIFFPEYEVYNKIEDLGETADYEARMEEGEEEGEAMIRPPVAIAYSVVDREHFEQSHRKPAYKKRYQDDETGKNYTVFAEIFVSELEFKFIGQNYKAVNQQRKWFEKFIITQKANLKNSGIIRIIFEEQRQDDTIEINNNYYVVQPIRYYARHVHKMKVSYDEIKEIESRVEGMDHITEAQVDNLAE